MEIMRKASISTLYNSGVQSEQLLFPENSSSRRVTITRVTMQPGAVNPPHRHAKSRFGSRSRAAEHCCLTATAPSRSPSAMWSGSRTATSTVFATPPMGCSFICRSRRRRSTSARHTPRTGANRLSLIPRGRMSTRLGPLAPMPPRLRGSSCGPSVLPLSLPEQTRRSTLFHFKPSVQCRLLGPFRSLPRRTDTSAVGSQADIARTSRK